MQIIETKLQIIETTICSNMIQIYQTTFKQTALVGCEKLWRGDDYQNKADAKTIFFAENYIFFYNFSVLKILKQLRT